MIENLSPNVRKVLIESRVTAMRGQKELALARLRETLGDNSFVRSPVDEVGLLMLLAEILFLDGETDSAFKVFMDEMIPKLAGLPEDIRAIAADNQQSVALTRFDSGAFLQFYRLFDYRKLAGIELWDPEEIVQAEAAAKSGKHFDALPAYWRLLRRAYLSGCWRSYHLAASRFAGECMELGRWLDEAAYHSIMAQDLKLARKAAGALLLSRQVEPVRRTISRVMETANLLKHATVGCAIVTEVADAVPDDQVGSLFSWLIKRCSMGSNKGNQASVSALEEAWKALQNLTPRLSPAQAGLVIRTAVAHETWKAGTPLREHLIVCVNCCVQRLSPRDIGKLSVEVMPLAKELKSDFDYANAIDLLCAIAQRGDSKLKSSMAETLYPRGRVTTHAFLVQVAHIFDKKPTDAKGIAELARKVADSIRLQVQHLRAGEEPKEVFDTYGQFSKASGDGKLIVQMSSGVALEALIAQKKFLVEKDVALLVDTILPMIEEPQNLLRNRGTLIQSLGKLAGFLSKGLCQRVFRVLKPLALGKLKLISPSMSAAEAKDPLNRFSIGDTSPDLVRGAALYSLAIIESERPGIYGTRLNSLMEVALLANEPEVRKFAFAAAQDLPKLSDALWTAVLLGCNDSDAKVAGQALHTIARRKNVRLSEGQWHMLIHSLVRAADSTDVGLRRCGARVIATRRSMAPKTVRKKVKDIARVLRGDVCHSVRRALIKDVRRASS